MKRGKNQSVFLNDNNELIAINLGADYCAEHEWGIDDMKNFLGVCEYHYKKKWFGYKTKKENLGIEKRRVNDSSTIYSFLDTPIVVDNQEFHGLAMLTTHIQKKYFDFNNLQDYYFFSKKEKDFNNDFLTWWSSKNFAILHHNKKIIEQLYNAFKNNDVAVWLGGGGVFQNAGLCFGIISKLPEELKISMKEKDLDLMHLNKVANKTKIFEKLENANKKYFALRPKWKDDEKTTIHFWLNPYNQSAYNFGWFTVEELEQWCNDEGPIMKNLTNINLK